MRPYDIHAQARTAQPTAVATATLPASEIGPWLAKTYQTVATAVTASGTHLAGPPFARYHRLAGGRFVIEAGFPVTTAIEGSAGARPSELPAGPAASTVHVGPYETMEPAYVALAAWVKEHGGEPAGDAWEIYFSDPTKEPDPATWRTEIVQPYRAA